MVGPFATALRSWGVLAFVVLMGWALMAGPAAAQNEQSKSKQPEKVSCIHLTRVEKSEIVDDSTILFYMRNGFIWENKMRFACPLLKSQGGFSYSVIAERLCSTDTITVLRIQSGACPLSAFTRYDPKQVEEAKVAD